jgi:hypothetical protein
LRRDIRLLREADLYMEESSAEKILKAPLPAQLGIDETSSGAVNEMDAESNSENCSALEETGGERQVCQSSIARPLGPEAATPVAAADGASGEGSLATGTRDEGQAQAVIAQLGEPFTASRSDASKGTFAPHQHLASGGGARADSSRQEEEFPWPQEPFRSGKSLFNARVTRARFSIAATKNTNFCCRSRNRAPAAAIVCSRSWTSYIWPSGETGLPRQGLTSKRPNTGDSLR